jgi:hypothetical protein
MPRNVASSRASTVAHAVEGLVHAITGLVDSVTGSAQGVGTAAKGLKAAVRGPGKGNPKLKSALKKSWANYTPKQRADRVRKMLAGRGLEPKGARKANAAPARAPKAKRAPKAAKGGAWASMTPEERAERVAKMRAGRARATGT